MTRRTLLWFAALLSLPAARAVASPRCGCSQPSWNAPNGAVVTYHSSGMISAVMDALGEWRTHIMLSHGNGWTTHSTANEDDLDVDDSRICDRPLNPISLEQMPPGLEQITLGGAAAFLSGQTDIRYIMADYDPDQTDARMTADWLWSDAPYQWDSSKGLYRVGWLDGSASIFRSYTYGVTQYMNGVYRINGGNSQQTGIVCSQAPAWAMASHWQTGATVGYHRYTHDQTVNAGVNLWWQVYNGCMDSNTSGFWGAIGAALAPIINGCSVSHTCSMAAWQVMNCFAFDPSNGGSNVGGCFSTGSSQWDAMVAGSGAARSLSPDGLTNFANGPDEIDSGHYRLPSPWATAPEQALQWSGSGSVCGCWD